LGENGKGLSTGFISFDEIPKPEKEDDEDLGVTWNWKPVNKYYAQKIKELQSKFQNAPQTQTTSVKVEPTPYKGKQEITEPLGKSNEPDGLPF
jgi:hypothetical protein